MKSDRRKGEPLIPLKLLDTKKLAQDVVKKLVERAQINLRQTAQIIGLYGELGAGKTTFMQFLGEELGIKEKILSPTFVIEKIYKITPQANPNFDHLIHIDAYRLESPREMLNLGWAEIVKNPRNIIAVEWADRIAELLPPDHMSIDFSHHDEESRVITLD